MTHLFRKRLQLAALLLLTLIVATGCVSARQGVSWPSVSLVGDNPYILLAYNNFMVQIDPSDGTEVKLLDTSGNVRVDPDTGEARTWDVTDSALQAFYTAPHLSDDGVTLLTTRYDSKFVEIDYAAARIDTAGVTNIAGNPVADMAFDDETNRIYVGYNSANLEAFDRDSLDLLWTFETRSGVWGKPLLHEGVLYFTSMDHYLYAVDTAAGEQIWQLNLGGAAAGTPTLVNGRLYIGTFARTLVEVTLDGELTASYEAANWIWGSPAAEGDMLYVADLSGFVYALSTPGLTEQWIAPAAPTGIRPSPVVLEDAVVVVSRTGRLVWLNKSDGSEIQSREIQDEVLSDLVIIPAGEGLREPLIIVTGIHNNPTLAAFTTTDGQRVWEYRR